MLETWHDEFFRHKESLAFEKKVGSNLEHAHTRSKKSNICEIFWKLIFLLSLEACCFETVIYFFRFVNGICYDNSCHIQNDGYQCNILIQDCVVTSLPEHTKHLFKNHQFWKCPWNARYKPISILMVAYER